MKWHQTILDYLRTPLRAMSGPRSGMTGKEARMARKKRVPTPGTIGLCLDELREKVALVLNELDPSADTGRKGVDPRRALDGMI